MKHSKLSCFNGFYCCRYYHCWLTILFIIALIIAQVSPKITSTTTTTTRTTTLITPSESSTITTITNNFATNELQSTSFIEDNNKSNERSTTMSASTHISMSNSVRTLSTQPQQQQQQQQQQHALAWLTLSPPTPPSPPSPPLSSSPSLSPLLSSSTLPSSSSAAVYGKYMAHTTALTNNGNNKVRRARQLNSTERTEKCRLFVEGEASKNELYSPDYPNDYPRNISCTRVIKAPKGQIVRIDFRNSFHIEAKEECKFDFLEIRDGQYGYSELIGKFCGTDFPPEITSRERYLWLHFQSDESIEYSGFTAVFEFLERSRDSPSTDINCTIEKDGYEGYVNLTDVPSEIMDIVVNDKIPLDCLWRIEVPKNWKIQVRFLAFKLNKPNDCDSNFLDVFPEDTVMPARMKNFCGSAGEGVISQTNVLHIHFYAEKEAIESSFDILFTAFRDRLGTTTCVEGEYDCEDLTCIWDQLVCNGRDNCKFRWDEEGCVKKSDGQSEHVVIILVVFGLILGGMMITFLVNCMRKLIHDQRIIREHIRQSKESRLDEMGRHSKARSKENIPLDVSLRQKQSQTSLEILADLPEHYYPEVVPLPPSHASKDSKDKEHSILRHQQHDATVQTSICDNSSTTTIVEGDTHDFAKGAPSNACDMGCQTRESLFVTTPILSKSSIGSVGIIPPPRLSTFAKEPSIKSIPEPPEAMQAPHHSHLHEQQLASLPLADLPPRVYHEPICHLHHHQHPLMRLPQTQHPYDDWHPHAHHHHYHTQRQQLPMPPLPPSTSSMSSVASQPSQPQMKSEITLPISVPHSAATTEAAQLPSTAVAAGSGRPKLKQRKDQSKEYIDVRNSAPDVIIMTSH